ncbi:MAG TPA: hypothetical protein VJR50_18645 [Mycobacterium sp.]|nr:hypothetical protein [Mycobacterium sp.]
MSAIQDVMRRVRRYLSEAELISVGAVVAASTGEPVLAHQLERIRAQAADPRLHRRVGRLETT